MGRPSKKVKRKRVDITIDPAILADAKALAAETDEGLSGMVERLLTKMA